jgi:hypothetical protein
VRLSRRQIEHVSVGRSKRREHLDTRRDHLVVVRNEPPDLHVIAFGINAKMTLDRMSLTGHELSLHGSDNELRDASAAGRSGRRSRDLDRRVPQRPLNVIAAASSVRGGFAVMGYVPAAVR